MGKKRFLPLICATISLFSPGMALADLASPGPVEYAPAFLILFLQFIAVAAVARLLLFGIRKLFFSARAKGTRPFSRFNIDVIVVAILCLGLFTLLWVDSKQRRRRPRRSEAKSNLGAIRSTEVAFFAEWSYWIGNQPPTPVRNRAGVDEKVAWVPNTRFSILGFAPEGRVYCSYSLEGPDRPTAEEGFIARAYCDYDGDGSVAVYTITSESTDITKTGGNF